MVKWKQGRDSVEGKQIDRREQTVKREEMKLKGDEKQQSGGDFMLAEDRGLEKVCHHSLSVCVKEVLQCSKAAPLFRGETRTSDSGFMVPRFYLVFGMNG